MPSASRIDAFAGSRRLAFSSATVAWAFNPFARWSRPCRYRLYVSLMSVSHPPAPKIGEIALEHVLGSRQVSGRAERERQDPPAGVDRVLKRDRQLEGRPLELAERGGQLPREEPERGGGDRAGRLWGRRVGDLGDVAALNAHGGLMPDLRDFPHTEAPGRPGGREALARRGEVAGLVDRVGSRHEERGVRAGGERAAHGIRRAERLRLPGVANGEPEAGAVADERPNLFGKVA